MYNDGMSFSKRIVFAIIILLALVFSAIIITGYAALAAAETALQSQDYRGAAESYIRASRILFWRGDLLEKIGIAASKQPDCPAAIDYLERAKLAEQGQLALASCYYQIGDLTSAQKKFEEGASRYQTASFYEGLAFIYRAQKKWDEERGALENQIRLDMGNASAHYRLGVLLTILDSEIALPELLRAASLDPQFDPAAQTLRAALNLSAAQPNASRQWVTTGRALGLVEEWDLAIVAFEKSIALDSQNAEAWAWLGEAEQHRGREGRAELDRAVALDSKSSIVRALRGLYWDRRQNYRQALTEYLLAAEYDPQNPAWRASVGGAYSKTGDLVFALEAYQRATELAPNESEYWRLLALFCADNGAHVEDVGLPAAQKAALLAPNDPLALDALGYVYYSTGRYANAEKILSDAIERFPQHNPAHIHLALTYLAQGNRSSAFGELIHVRDADANGADGKLAEELIAKYFP
ncbi:MAG: tetratricopeptide repeat protein [Anaerolineales bacterium]|nr:tetratricopeptide repeat protein [Anaerolineales bacterium]